MYMKILQELSWTTDGDFRSKSGTFFYPHTAVKQNKITKDCFIGTMFVFLSSNECMLTHSISFHHRVCTEKLCSAPMNDFIFIIIIKAWSTQAIYFFFDKFSVTNFCACVHEKICLNFFVTNVFPEKLCASVMWPKKKRGLHVCKVCQEET